MRSNTVQNSSHSWKTYKLKDLVHFLDGDRRPIKSSNRISGDYPYYGASGIVDYVNDYIFDGEYVLLGEDGENILSRNTRLVYHVKGKIWVNNHAHVLACLPHVNPIFLTEKLESLNYKNLNSGTAQPKLNKETCSNIVLQIPPLAEQQKIAQALTDADNYISALEKLIEKKKMIKEGLMVNLLTGKQRLKEFAFNEDGTAKGYKDSELGKIPEDWEIGNLGNLTTLKARIGWQGLTVAEYLDQGDYYLVTGTDFNEGFIDFDHCPYVDKSRYSQDPNIQLKNNDVLVTKDGTIGKVAFIENLDLPATLNSGVFVVRPIGSGINSKFLYYILMSKYFDDFLKKITAGSTITHLYQKDFVHFDFVLPTLEEQNSIVNCLSNVDHDLKILKKKLTKAKNLKQGMMQKLLTGEIRLA